jgi:hypothetical protein
MRLHILPIICLFLLPAMPAAGQTHIVGRVIDEFSEMPIANAQVDLLARDGSVLGRADTNEMGTFEFEV